MNPVIEIHRVSKKYKIKHLPGGYLSLREKIVKSLKFERTNTEDFWALNDISFDVQLGESVGIIGRNGAGKSTLLKILSKITPPTSGHILARGRIASLLEVGTGFHPELTGRENIFFNGSLLGMKRKEIEIKFDEIVDFSGVEKFLDTPLKHYSSGMQLRLAFAVAAFLEPEILIIDEVLAVGDAEFQKKCLGKMEDVSKQGRTILFVSHNMDAVAKLCRRAILLKNGTISADSNEMAAVISEYVSGTKALNTEGTKKILNNKNEFHTVTEFSLTDANGDVHSNIIPYSKEIWVSIKGKILSPHSGLNMGYIIYDQSNKPLFWSYCNDQNGPFKPLEKVGDFFLRSQIPAKFLNDGDYRVELASVIHNHRWLIEPGTEMPITFQVKGGFRNVIMTPQLQWVDGNEPVRE